MVLLLKRLPRLGVWFYLRQHAVLCAELKQVVDLLKEKWGPYWEFIISFIISL